MTCACPPSRYFVFVLVLVLVQDVPCALVTELACFSIVLACMQRTRVRAVPAIFLRGGFAFLLRGGTDCGVRYDGKHPMTISDFFPHVTGPGMAFIDALWVIASPLDIGEVPVTLGSRVKCFGASYSIVLTQSVDVHLSQVGSLFARPNN